MIGRIEDVGHETGRFDADGPAEFHALLETPKNRWREDVLGTLPPGSEGTTRLDFFTENESNEDVQTAKREEEEGGDECEAVDTMGKNCSPNPIVIQGRIRKLFINCAREKGRADSQALNDAESSDAKIISKDGEEPVEESRGPTDFREEEDGDLSDDQETVEDGPEDASRLVGNGRIAIEKAWARTRVDHGRKTRTGHNHNRDSWSSSCAKRARLRHSNCSGRS